VYFRPVNIRPAVRLDTSTLHVSLIEFAIDAQVENGFALITAWTHFSISALRFFRVLRLRIGGLAAEAHRCSADLETP
jgi:hypothetical protein